MTETVELVPAVQYSRASARRVACVNNLHQIGAAIEAHASTHQALPSLYNGTFLPQPRTAIDEFHFHSWRTSILPQLEQSALFSNINFAQPATVPANLTVLNVKLAVFVCPSTTPDKLVPDIYQWNDGTFPTTVLGTAARSDYEAMGGVQIAAQTKGSLDLSIIQFGAWGEPTYDKANGASIRYRKAGYADITDGLSNTILVGERAGRPDRYVRGEPVQVFGTNPLSNADNHQAAWAISTHIWWLVLPYPNPSVNSGNSSLYSFHSSGANALLGDGSVRFLKDSSSPGVLKALATRAGGEVIEAY